MDSSITRSSTTTCDVVGSSTQCITVFQPEFSYLDWLSVNLWIIFLLSFIALGLFISPIYKRQQ